MARPPNQRLREDIDNSISNGMSATDFRDSVRRIIGDIFCLADRQEMVTTSSYLSYRISAELMRSNNQAQQHAYAEVCYEIFTSAYSNAAPLDVPPIDAFSIATNFYTFYARLMSNGRDPSTPYTYPNDPLTHLRNIIGSNFGPWNAFIDIRGATMSDPRVRVVGTESFQICRPNRCQPESVRFGIRVGGFNVNSNSTQNVTCATWNMQGGAAPTQNKWRESVLALTNEANIVCLQECGQPPESAVQSGALHGIDQFGEAFEMPIYQWAIGSRSRQNNFLVYFFDVNRLRVNLAFVMRENAYTVENLVIVSDGLTGNRPAVGLRIAGAAGDRRSDFTIFTFHAISGGGPNCPRMIREITRHSETPFAVLGDFNRDPRPPGPNALRGTGEWISPPGIAEIVQADGPTHGTGPSASMLDYAVTNGTVNETEIGRTLSPAMASNHTAVVMDFTFMS